MAINEALVVNSITKTIWKRGLTGRGEIKCLREKGFPTLYSRQDLRRGSKVTGTTPTHSLRFVNREQIPHKINLSHQDGKKTFFTIPTRKLTPIQS